MLKKTILAALFVAISASAHATCGTGSVGTPQPLAYLLGTEFQDGQAAGSITPGCLRDFIASTRNVPLNLQTASYTLVLADAGKVVEMNAATGTTVTIPTNASVAFPIGQTIWVRQVGVGAVSISPASGVTIDYPSTTIATSGQWQTIALHQRAANEWEGTPPVICNGCSITASGVTVNAPATTDTLTITPGTLGDGPLLQASGPESTVDAWIQTQGVASTTRITNTGSTDFTEIGGSSTGGSGPDIFCSGPETSVNCNIQPKGFGNVYFYERGGSASATLAIGPYQLSGALPGPLLQAQGTGLVPLVLSGQSGGPIVSQTPDVDQAVVRITTGSSTTVSVGIDIVVLDGVSSTFTLTMPAAPYDGQRVELNCGSAVSTLTVSGNGHTMKGAATSCSTTQGHMWRYNGAATAWYEAY